MAYWRCKFCIIYRSRNDSASWCKILLSDKTKINN